MQHPSQRKTCECVQYFSQPCGIKTESESNTWPSVPGFSVTMIPLRFDFVPIVVPLLLLQLSKQARTRKPAEASSEASTESGAAPAS